MVRCSASFRECGREKPCVRTGADRALEINDSGVYLPVRHPLETPKFYDRNAITAPSLTSNVLTNVPAVPTAGEAFVLAFQIECLNHILQPQKSPGGDRAVQHLARELRFVQAIVRKFPQQRLYSLYPAHSCRTSPRGHPSQI